MLFTRTLVLSLVGLLVAVSARAQDANPEGASPAVVVAPAAAETSGVSAQAPATPFGVRLLAEAPLGIVSGALLGTLGGGMGGIAAMSACGLAGYDAPGEDGGTGAFDCFPLGLVVGAGIGWVSGVALGVFAGGRLTKSRSNGWFALLGSAAGFGLGVGAGALAGAASHNANVGNQVAVISALSLTLIGAILAFEVATPRDVAVTSPGRTSQGHMQPYVSPGLQGRGFSAGLVGTF